MSNDNNGKAILDMDHWISKWKISMHASAKIKSNIMIQAFQIIKDKDDNQSIVDQTEMYMIQDMHLLPQGLAKLGMDIVQKALNAKVIEEAVKSSLILPGNVNYKEKI